MRTLLVAGTAGLFLALGAASAYAVPPNSPYATIAPLDTVDGAVVTPVNGPVYVAPRYEEDVVVGPPAAVEPETGMIEGRAAYIEDQPLYVTARPGFVYGPPAYSYARPRYAYAYRYPSPFPLSVLPWNW
jgi:hypothetical protein